MPSVSLRLLRSIPAERLKNVGDYIDYWDSMKETWEVGEGLLYTLIKAGDPLPANFETRNQHRERRERERREENLNRAGEVIAARYRHHSRVTLDRYIGEELGEEEFQKRVDDRMRELAQDGGFFQSMKPEMLARLAADDVRRGIVPAVVVPYEEFYRNQLPIVLETLQAAGGHAGMALAEDVSASAPHGDEQIDPLGQRRRSGRQSSDCRWTTDIC